MQYLDRFIATQNAGFWEKLWKNQLWSTLLEIANFRRHQQDENKGKHIFKDKDPNDQKLALRFFQRLRELLLEWSRKYSRTFDNRPTKFKETYYQVFGGQPDIQRAGTRT